ncbi:gas vesicle protein, GvpL/GvpF family [Streptomyces turgidiscabies Car8]|uniref:Gas vesicle protein, GvpL/GvpF family n=1 Tax=Streptomyces turgidiscabies (strain Car8) TaxID=698760 RepID=L7FC12_STRT8|nr:gas vesicle protein, GvpL/GvpF family [Streptomyces turgidiscabies Car8]GAQ73063.1 Gas vesicle synthesis protein GvpL/GvpF [Streptomyces turgidiscabies]
MSTSSAPDTGNDTTDGTSIGTYVYGITAATHPALPSFAEELRGVGDPPRTVRVLTAGTLAAIVSDAPEKLRPKRKDLLAHQHVLEEAGGAGCVLPMRFGSVAPDDDAVTSVLTERAEHYEERLQALDGNVEYNVKASHEEEAVLHRVLAENPEIRAFTEANRQAGGGSYDDRVRLGEMVVSAVKAREAEDAVEVRQALEPSAVAVSVGAESTGWLANVSFLVARDSAEVFLTATEQLRKARPYLELRVHGPLPPYSFVEPGPGEPAGSPAGGLGAGADQSRTWD